MPYRRPLFAARYRSMKVNLEGPSVLLAASNVQGNRQSQISPWPVLPSNPPGSRDGNEFRVRPTAAREFAADG